MIIVSQDKREIINFDRISEIAISGDEICITDNLKDERGLKIGKYKSEKRAKEVLIEIIKFYEDVKQKMILQNIYTLNTEGFDFVYIMPKK